MNHEIEQALGLLGIPFSYEEHDEEDTTYIVYSMYDNVPNRFADNDELTEVFYYQFDIFSKSDYTAIEKQLREVLKVIGGVRRNSYADYSEGYYQKSIRFQFLKEI